MTALGALLMAIAAVLVLSSELVHRARLAGILGVMAGLGLLLEVTPNSVFGLHVVLIVEDGYVEADSALLRARLGDDALIEIVAITDDGLAQRARGCVNLQELARTVQFEEPAPWGEVLGTWQCNPLGLRRTVVAVVPSAELAARMGRADGASEARDALAAAWAAQHVPVTLLHAEDPSAQGRLLLTRPYVGTSPLRHERVPAYAYQLRPTVAIPGSATTESVRVRRAGSHDVTRNQVPVHRWDSRQQIVGPIPLISEEKEVEEDDYEALLTQGVHFFRIGEAETSWLAVTVDDLEVAVDSGAASYAEQLRARWESLSLSEAPVTPTDLVGLAAAQNSKWTNRSQPFAITATPFDSDALVVPPGGRSPPPSFFDEAGRALLIDLTCGAVERHGTVHLVFDHSRLGLQPAGAGLAANVLQMRVYEAFHRALRRRAEVRDGFPQATFPRAESSVSPLANPDRPYWEPLVCDTALIGDERLRRSRPVVGREGDASAFFVNVAPPLLPNGCAAPSTSESLEAAVRGEYLPSNVAARLHAIAANEPQLAGDASLSGTTIVVFALEVPQLRVDQIAPLASAPPGLPWFSWNALPTESPRAALSGFLSTAPWEALRRLSARGADIFIVPIALPEALVEAGRDNALLARMLDRQTPQMLVQGELASLVRRTIRGLVATPADADAVGIELAAHVLQRAPERVVGGSNVRDARFQRKVTLYDDVCATGSLLEAEPRRRGLITRARYDLFSPTNWLFDEGITGLVTGERIGAKRYRDRSRVGLGGQVLADALIESARPFGNRRSAGASSVTWHPDGRISVVVPAHMEVYAGKGSDAPRSLTRSSLPGGQFAAHALDGASNLDVLELRVKGSGDSRLILHAPPPADAVASQFLWLPAVQATGGFVLQSGSIADYHRTSFWPYVLTLLAAIVTALAFSPWITPWAIQTWWSRSRGQTILDAKDTRLDLGEQALIAEAGHAAGRIVARRTAGEPEGERGFVAGDSPSAIQALPLYSMTAPARLRGVPQLLARVRTRRAQQVPQVSVLLDASGLQHGLQGAYIRASMITVTQVISRVAITSGSSVVLLPLSEGDEWITLRGSSDDAAIAGAIERVPTASLELRNADDLAGSGLCVIISPVDSILRDDLVSFVAGLRAQSIRCLLVEVSMRPVELPGMYLAVNRYWGVLNRQRYGQRGLAATHDREVARELEGAGIDSVVWCGRHRSIGPLCEALVRAMEGPG